MRTTTAIAALLGALLGSAGAGAQELGRLFFTPEQRAALDARRKARVPDKPAAAPQAESPVTRVNGAVQRSGGRSTVWVNGEAIPEGAAPGTAQPAPSRTGPGRVTLPAGEGAQRDLRESGNAFYSVKRCQINRTGTAATGATIVPRLRANCEIDLITIIDRAAKA